MSLHCIFIFQSLIAESGCSHFGPLDLDAINLSSQTSLSSRDRARQKADRWSGMLRRKKNKTKIAHWQLVTVNTRQQMDQYQIISRLLSFSWTQTGLKPLNQHGVSCMHHCYQGDHLLSLAFYISFCSFYLLQGILEEKTISF